MIMFSDMRAAGFIPDFLDEENPNLAKYQINANYIEGWFPFHGFIFHYNPEDKSKCWLEYPGDPPTRLVSWAKFRDEELLLFEYAWLVIRQLDGSWECARID